jgi:outer membrane protein OmpA-like peptidoglycan-associated protein
LGAGSTADALSPAPPFVVCFDVGSRALKASGIQELEKAAAQVSQFGSRARLSVEARTDGTEARSHSTTLSADRGSAVKARLVLLGVPPEHIHVRAFADSAPLSESNRDDPQNRCATIWLSSAL